MGLKVHRLTILRPPGLAGLFRIGIARLKIR
jgi:hypothetical protein